jgi:hypothetical protein
MPGPWGYAASFKDVGLVPPGRQLRVHRPVRGLAAWVSPDLVSVTVKSPPEAIYEANATPGMAAEARKRRAVLFVVTHVMDPGTAEADPLGTQRAIMGVLQTGEALCGWAALRE